MINRFHVPYRLDRTDKGGGIMLFVREHIPSRNINVVFSPKIEAIVIEINLKKRKWLIIDSYNPYKNMIGDHLHSVGNYLNESCKRYENFIIIGDFNSETKEDAMQDFCSVYSINNVVNEPTCFKNIDHPSCIDLILTNKPRSFQNTSVMETGLSDFHRLTGTVMKSKFEKQVPKVLIYRNYKSVKNENFRNDLFYE